MSLEGEIKSNRLFKGRYLPLLITLNLIFFLYAPLEGTKYGTLVLAFLFSAFMVAGTFTISGRRRGLIVSILLVLPALLARWIHTFSPEEEKAWLVVVGHVSLILFMVFVASLVLIHVLSERHVTGDTLIGSICVYLLMGFTFAVLFSLVEFLSPGAFWMAERLGVDSTHTSLNSDGFSYLIYYSFVTLTTMGYGDMTPVNSLARVLTVAEGVGGQIYLAAFVARLVGLHIVWHSGRNTSENPPEHY